jgi:predicted transcriptional regulator
MSTQPAPDRPGDALLAVVAAAPLVEATVDEAMAYDEGLAAIQAGLTLTADEVRAELAARSDE